MFDLALDVFDQGVSVPPRAGERAVALLPAFELGKDPLLLDPHAGRDLEIFHQTSQRDHWMERGEDVDVILHAADAVEMAVLVLQDAPEVAEQIVAAGSVQNPASVLCREDEMVEDLGVGGHGDGGFNSSGMVGLWDGFSGGATRGFFAFPDQAKTAGHRRSRN